MPALVMEPAVVEHRVDYLVLAFRVSFARAAELVVRARQAVARRHGRAAFTWGGRSWMLTCPRRGDGWVCDLVSENWRARLDFMPVHAGLVVEPASNDGATLPGSPVEVDVPGWSVELIPAAQYLADHPIGEVIREARAIVRAWGVCVEERLRRCDLACDVAGFDLRPDDWQHLIRRSRATWTRFEPLAVDDRGRADTTGEVVARSEAAGTRRVSGLRVGRGDVVCRVYDKPEELRRAPERAAREEARWRRAGWDGAAPVTRVEFQLRGAALTELGARGLTCRRPNKAGAPAGPAVAFEDYLPALWSYCTRWLRLSRREDLERRPALRRLDPRWAPVCRLVWSAGAPVDVLVRVRHRGGASPAMALGSLLSALAAAGRFDDLPELSEDAQSYAEEPAARLADLMGLIAAWGADLLGRELSFQRDGPVGALVHVATLVNAYRARARATPGLRAAGPRGEVPAQAVVV